MSGSGLKRLAMSGLALPYAVGLVLILAFKSVEGHSGYTVPAGELDRFAGIVTRATWAAVALSGLLSLPYGAEFIRKKVRLQAGLTAKVATGCALTIAYGGIVAANGALAVFTHMVARMVLEGAT